MESLELISKYIKGEMTDNEKEIFDRWLKTDEQNVLLFNEVKNTWEATGKITQNIIINKEKAWRTIQQKIKEEQKIVSINVKKINYKNGFLRIAAILIVGFFVTWLVLKDNQTPELVFVQTTDQEKMLVMPDSSKVLLNKNSKLIYPKEFTKNIRNVDLEGEAFFEVTKNLEKPFVIKNKDFDIKILGTSFNVMAYSENKEAVVTVVTGKVALTSKNKETIVLVKDEVGVLSRSDWQLNKKINSNSNFLSWKTKKIEFNNADFSEVVETLEKYFSMTIDVKEKNIFKCRFTGYFENPTLQDVLAILEKTLLLKTIVNDKQIIVTGAGC